MISTYDGNLTTLKDSQTARARYTSLGIEDCYIIDFEDGPLSLWYSLDPGPYPQGFAHMANHSAKNPNVTLAKSDYNKDCEPTLWFVASCNISNSQEILWNYNDRTSQLPFLAK